MDCKDESANLSSFNDRRSNSESHQPGTLAKEALIPPAIDADASSSENNVVMEKPTQQFDIVQKQKCC